MTTYTDAALVENLLKDAIGYGSTPELEDEQIERMVSLAMPDGIATGDTLQRAAVMAWGWKAGLTANQYDLKAASGASLTRSQWFEQCLAMARLYQSGVLSVDGSTLGIDLSMGDTSAEIMFTAGYLTT